MPGEVWRDYMTPKNPNILTLGAGQKVWIMERSIEAYKYFNALQRLTASGALTITVYVFRNKSSIGASPSAIAQNISPANEPMSSGWGDSSYIYTNLTLNSSELEGNDIYHRLFGFPCGNINEMVGIHRVQGGYIEPSLENSGLLGNYGVQYHFTVNLVNQDPVNAKKFIGHVGCNPWSCCMVITNGSQTEYKMMRGFAEEISAGYRDIDTDEEKKYSSWRWMEYVVPRASSATIVFQLFHGANGSQPGAMKWSVKNA
jgi:hypothetical protein